MYVASQYDLVTNSLDYGDDCVKVKPTFLLNWFFIVTGTLLPYISKLFPETTF